MLLQKGWHFLRERTKRETRDGSSLEGLDLLVIQSQRSAMPEACERAERFEVHVTNAGQSQLGEKHQSCKIFSGVAFHAVAKQREGGQACAAQLFRRIPELLP